jgi:hypothetical protein
LFEAIRTNLDSDIELIEMHNNINDEEFADAMFDLFMKQWAARRQTTPAAG